MSSWVRITSAVTDGAGGILMPDDVVFSATDKDLIRRGMAVAATPEEICEAQQDAEDAEATSESEAEDAANKPKPSKPKK